MRRTRFYPECRDVAHPAPIPWRRGKIRCVSGCQVNVERVAECRLLPG
jgi:hypothetical protein